MPPKPPLPNHAEELVTLECLVCANACSILGVFATCGHFLCYACALRIHALDRKGCPVCREAAPTLLVTQRAPQSEDGFDMDVELLDLKSGPTAVCDKTLNCRIDGERLAEHVRKLYEFTCPRPECWKGGMQEPFLQEQMLREHLQYDHQLRYCKICVKDRHAFLSEQSVYTEREYEQHLSGLNLSDPVSFQGHPPCKFCKNERFYDGEHLLKHMQHAHFTCDVCNRGEFTFTYYKNRDKLLEHFQRCHKLCEHNDCSHLDPMLRVFHSDLELQAHRQRAHGAGNRGIALESLGFRFSSAADAPGAGFSPSSSNPAGISPSTGSNSHALRIYFDHVSRLEVVDTMPKVSGKGDARGGKPHRGGRANEGGDEGTSSTRHGLPLYCKDPRLQLQPIQVVVERAVSSSPPHHGGKGSQSSPLPSWGGGPSRNSAPGASNSYSQRHSGGVGDGSNGAPAAVAATGSRPLSMSEKQQAFDERLHRYMANPQQLLQFRHACADFLSSKLLASEFYAQLETLFFPKRSHELDDFFPHLVATIPNPAKADALKAIRQMQSAPERQRQLKSQEEDSKKSDLEAKLARSRQAVQKLGAAAKGSSNGKRSVWATAAASGAGSSVSPVSSPQSSVVQQFPAAAPAVSPTSWGGRPTTQGTVAPPQLHSDPTDFPTLPTSSRKAHHQTAKPVAKNNNAWFAAGKK